MFSYTYSILDTNLDLSTFFNLPGRVDITELLLPPELPALRLCCLTTLRLFLNVALVCLATISAASACIWTDWVCGIIYIRSVNCEYKYDAHTCVERDNVSLTL